MRSKVKEAARELGLDVELTTLDNSTATVAQAAAALGVEEGQIAKSIVFVMDGEPVVVVASGRHRIDDIKVCDALDTAEGRMATADEVRAATGFAIGGVPPIGHGLPVVFDEALLRHERVWAAAGDPHSLFCVDPRELVACTAPAQIAAVGAVSS